MTGLVGLDWGTTSLRAYDLEPDTPRELCSTTMGIKRFETSCDYGGYLSRLLTDNDCEGATVVMSGMITSRQGWFETPYVQTPATIRDLAASAVHSEVAGSAIWSLPGVCHQTTSTDVMRGEETQIVGVADDLGADATVVLPGTHSKWAQWRDGAISEFSTFVTGEMFEMVREHSIIGALIDSADFDESAFDEGVRLGADRSDSSGGLLHELFSVRTKGLFDSACTPSLHSYLSGMLIGKEIADATARFEVTSPVHLVGQVDLVNSYRRALDHIGVAATPAAPDAAGAGLKRVASMIGLT